MLRSADNTAPTFLSSFFFRTVLMVIMSKSSSGTRHFNVAIATSSSGSRRKLDSGMSSKENGVSESLKQNQFNGGELWYHHHQQQVESLFLLKDMQKKKITCRFCHRSLLFVSDMIVTLQMNVCICNNSDPQ